MNKEQENVIQGLLNGLNTAAKEYDVHISSTEDMLLKVDGAVVARMYYDAVEKQYVVIDEREQDNG